MRRSAGFTILELLVAAAIMLVLLGALSGLLQSSLQASRANDEATNARQNRESAVSTLQYELGLAGYRGTLQTDYATTATSVALIPFVLTPSTSGGSEQIAIKYFENRVYGSASKEVKTVTFSINTQSNTLLRAEGGTAEPIATGVKKLRVARYLTEGATGSETDCLTACPATPPNGTIGIILSLTYLDNTVQRIPVTFRNPVS